MNNIKTFEELIKNLNELLTVYDPYFQEGICKYTNCLNLPTEQAPNGQYNFIWRIDRDKIMYYFYIDWGWENEQDDYCENRIMLAKSKDPQNIYNVIKAIKECEDAK